MPKLRVGMPPATCWNRYVFPSRLQVETGGDTIPDQIGAICGFLIQGQSTILIHCNIQYCGWHAYTGVSRFRHDYHSIPNSFAQFTLEHDEGLEEVLRIQAAHVSKRLKLGSRVQGLGFLVLHCFFLHFTFCIWLLNPSLTVGAWIYLLLLIVKGVLVL